MRTTDQTNLTNFYGEIQVMKDLKHHANIVQVQILSFSFLIFIQFFGACTSNSSELCIVTEYCANRSLDKYIQVHKKAISVEQNVKWINGIAAGMYHLAKEGVVHRDLGKFIFFLLFYST